MKNTWNTIMGSDTLVDLVALIWSLPSATINKVKSVANDVLDGIRIAGEFITNLVIGPIVKAMFSSLSNFVEATAITLNSIFTSVSFSFSSNSLTISYGSESTTINFSVEGFKIIISNNDIKMSLSNLLILPIMKFETLSPESDADRVKVISDVAQMGIITTSFFAGASFFSSKAEASILYILLLGWLINEGYQSDTYVSSPDAKTYFRELILFHLLQTLAFLFPFGSLQGLNIGLGGFKEHFIVLIKALLIGFNIGLDEWNDPIVLFTSGSFWSTTALFIMSSACEAILLKNPLKLREYEGSLRILAAFHFQMLISYLVIYAGLG